MSEYTDRERLIQMSAKMDSLIDSFVETKVAMKDLTLKVDELSKEQSRKFSEIDDRNQQIYVTKLEFDPIKRLVYGAVGLVLTAVLVALITIIVNAPTITPIIASP